MGNIIKAEVLFRQNRDSICVIDLAESSNNQDDEIIPDAEEIAKAIIEQAKQDAQVLISAASKKAEVMQEQGYQDGFKKGQDEALRDKKFYSERFTKLEAELVDHFQKSWNELEPEMIMLSVDIARKIVKHEIESNDNFVLNTIREALRQLRDRQDIKIWVNPEDYQLVISSKDDIKSFCDGIRSMEIIENRRTDKGGCLIESKNGHLDARLETQFSVVENAMLEAIRDGKNNDLN